MAKFRVDLQASAGFSVVVEAPDPEAAIDEAFERAPSDICAQCSGWGQGYSLDLGEWDVAGGADLCVEAVDE